MPNWCETTYCIETKNEETAKKLLHEFCEAFRENKIKTDFGTRFLGNVFAHLGYKNNVILDPRQTRCRGQILYCTADKNVVTVSTETAWEMMPEAIILMVRKYAPDSKITYQSIELNTGTFNTNDPSFENSLYVDVFEMVPEELEWLHYLDNSVGEIKIDEFCEDIRKSLGWSDLSNDDVLKRLSQEYGDLFSVSKWQIEPLEDNWSPCN